MSRSRPYTIAAVLQLLLSLVNLVAGFLFLPRGANALNDSIDSPPYVIIILAFCIGILGIVSAYGVWQNQKWGVLLTIVLRAVDAVSALPALFLAPTTDLLISAIVNIIVSALIIYLLLRPDRRPVGA